MPSVPITDKLRSLAMRVISGEMTLMQMLTEGQSTTHERADLLDGLIQFCSGGMRAMYESRRRQ